MTPPLAGIFVGGSGSRMGGIAKGLLRTAGGTTLVERWLGLLESLDMSVVLVGESGAYRGLGIEVVADDPPAIGPLGGLVALLRRAGPAQVVAVAGDMPFVSRALVGRLVGASEQASIVAPRRQGRWEPLCARYDAPRVLPLARSRARSRGRGHHHSLQRLLDDAHAVELELQPSEALELVDWDTPEDLSRRS